MAHYLTMIKIIYTWWLTHARFVDSVSSNECHRELLLFCLDDKNVLWLDSFFSFFIHVALWFFRFIFGMMLIVRHQIRYVCFSAIFESIMLIFLLNSAFLLIYFDTFHLKMAVICNFFPNKNEKKMPLDDTSW